ncbi:MAG: M23 family metallopeptidase [Leptospiraceae bacterium]|nr:M23 family metallopeptidase [Leptospiraceae bacterium]
MKTFLTIILILILGFLIPEKLVIPVKGATKKSWDKNDFWNCTWCKGNKIHYGIDIKGILHTPIISSSTGIIVFNGTLAEGGNVIIILGLKWRLHYYAHLNLRYVSLFQFVNKGETIGNIGMTGKTTGPHLHYNIVSVIPIFWNFKEGRLGWLRMFFLDPTVELLGE